MSTIAFENSPRAHTEAPDLDDSRAARQLVTPEGERRSDPELEQWVSDIGAKELLALYEDMVVVRRIDTEAVALQRQGQIALWAPLLGQEAAQIGSARALQREDFVFPTYREHAVAYCRGVGPGELMTMWRGTAGSGWDPYEVGMALPQIIIGAQTLHATGYAMGCAKNGSDTVTLAYLGDGATSQGDVSEAMVFASTFHAPVVFLCQNNHWAISEPVTLQAPGMIADRAPGFGIPSMRVDGNDVLAMLAATRVALERARRGEGPSFIEAVTYRMGPHTTSDDPTRYVDPLERECWADRDPIARIARLLEREGALDSRLRDEIAERANAVAATIRAACLDMPERHPLEVFDNVFTEPTVDLVRQRSQYAAYLSMFEGESADG